MQNLTADVGHYIISDKPMSEAQWIAERAKVIEAKAIDRQTVDQASVATPLPADEDATAKLLD